MNDELHCCDDVSTALGHPDDHCGSCHQDMNEGYEAGWIEVDGREIEVCCAVMRRWDDPAAADLLVQGEQPRGGVPESPSTP